MLSSHYVILITKTLKYTSSDINSKDVKIFFAVLNNLKKISALMQIIFDVIFLDFEDRHVMLGF